MSLLRSWPVFRAASYKGSARTEPVGEPKLLSGRSSTNLTYLTSNGGKFLALPPCDSPHTAVYCRTELASIYLTFLRKGGLILANGVGSIICLGTASMVAGLLYGETSTPRAFFLLFLILSFLFGGFYLFIRSLKVISPKRRIRTYPVKRL